MLTYKIIKQRNALDANKEEIYYPRLTESSSYDLDQLAEVISEGSSLTKSDIVGTLIALEDLIPTLLKRGNRVCLGSLGTFSLHAHVETHSDASEVSWRSFKKLMTRFRPGKSLKIQPFDVNFRLSKKG